MGDECEVSGAGRHEGIPVSDKEQVAGRPRDRDWVTGSQSTDATHRVPLRTAVRSLPPSHVRERSADEGLRHVGLVTWFDPVPRHLVYLGDLGTKDAKDGWSFEKDINS